MAEKLPSHGALIVVGWPTGYQKDATHDRSHSRYTDSGFGGFFGLFFGLFFGTWIDIWNRAPVYYGVIWPTGRQSDRIPKTDCVANAKAYYAQYITSITK